MKSLFKPSIRGFGLLYLLIKNTTRAFDTSSSSIDDDIRGAKGDIPNNSKGDGLDGRLADDRLKDNNHANIQPNDTGSSSSGTTYYYNNNQKYTNKSMFDVNNYDDEQTYLDLFGERAKELLTQHIIPSTDAECKWDWRMGRCEPYCICGFNFLWGDYHLGRSCRYRTFFPQDDEVINDVSNDKAWQQVWETQMPEESVAATPSTTSCTLPPESRYIQIIKQLNKGLTHSTVVIDQFQKVKSATTNVVDASVVSGKHHWKNMRQKACDTVKNKVEERASVRDQPVVLTKHGATWIRRVCGTEGNLIRGEDGVIDDEGITNDPAKTDKNDNAASKEESSQ